MVIHTCVDICYAADGHLWSALVIIDNTIFLFVNGFDCIQLCDYY